MLMTYAHDVLFVYIHVYGVLFTFLGLPVDPFQFRESNYLRNEGDMAPDNFFNCFITILSHSPAISKLLPW